MLEIAEGSGTLQNPFTYFNDQYLPSTKVSCSLSFQLTRSAAAAAAGGTLQCYALLQLAQDQSSLMVSTSL